MAIDNLIIDKSNGIFTTTLDSFLRELAVAVGNKLLVKHGQPVEGYGVISIGGMRYLGGKSGRSEYYISFPDSKLAEVFPDFKDKKGNSTIDNSILVYMKKPGEDIEAYLVSIGAIVQEEEPQKRSGCLLWGLLGRRESPSEKEEKKQYALVKLGEEIKFGSLQGMSDYKDNKIEFRIISTKEGMERDYQHLVSILKAEMEK